MSAARFLSAPRTRLTSEDGGTKLEERRAIKAILDAGHKRDLCEQGRVEDVVHREQGAEVLVLDGQLVRGDALEE
jgi:hypothetical protein